MKSKNEFIPLKPIKPDVTIGLWYQSKLIKLVRAMNDDYHNSINTLYKKQLVTDSVFSTQIDIILKKLLNKWSDEFNSISKKLSTNFINKVSYDTRQKLIKRAQHLITIEPDSQYKRIAKLQKALILESVGLIKDLPQKMYNDIQGDLMRGIVQGSAISPQRLVDLGLPPLTKYINEPLEKRMQQVIKRARLISRDQLFKATSAINNARMIDNGITHSEWNHSHGDKNPRPSHLKADGKIFENKKGLLVDGEYIFPAQLVGCTCFSTPHIKLSDD